MPQVVKITGYVVLMDRDEYGELAIVVVEEDGKISLPGMTVAFGSARTAATQGAFHQIGRHVILLDQLGPDYLAQISPEMDIEFFAAYFGVFDNEIEDRKEKPQQLKQHRLMSERRLESHDCPEIDDVETSMHPEGIQWNIMKNAFKVGRRLSGYLEELTPKRSSKDDTTRNILDDDNEDVGAAF